MASKTSQVKLQRAQSRKNTRVNNNENSNPLLSELFSPIEVTLNEKRDRIADEILRTEQSYVKSLNVLVQIFKNPMLDPVQKKELNITDEQIATLFSNIEHLINVNTELLKSLVERLSQWGPTQVIGDVLLHLTPFLRLYTTYTLNFEKAREVLNELSKKPAFHAFLEQQQADPFCNGLDFSSYLIMPIQRIPRYRLLLEDFIHNTPQNHQDYTKLSEALEKLKDVAMDMNKAVSEQESRERMVKVCKKFFDFKEQELIKPGRVFIHEGELEKVCRKDRQKRRFFLFSDVLIYAYDYPPNKYKVGRQFFLSSMKLKDIPDSSQRKLYNAFQIQSEQKSFVVLAENAEDKKFWLDKIDETQQAYLERIKSFNKFSSEQKADKNESKTAAAPIWIPDNEVKVCLVCQTKFTFTNRRHHCRQCGKVVCGPCSSQKKEVQGQGRVRVCTKCHSATNNTESIAKIQDLGEDSSDSYSEVEVLYELKALYDFNPDLNPQVKLKFKQGDIVNILQLDHSGWWLGELYGERGWVPSGYLEEPIEQY